MRDCIATREAVDELAERGLGPECEVCGRPSLVHAPESSADRGEQDIGKPRSSGPPHNDEGVPM